MRRTRRSQCTLRAKAFSMEALRSAEVKISRAVSRMRRNCWSRSGERAGMVGIIKKVVGRWSLVVSRSPVAVRSSMLAAGFGGHDLLDPIFDRYAHLFESPFKEMISGFDADQLLGVGEGVDERFEFSGGTEVIARATNEKFRLRARTQEFEIIDAAFDRDSGQAEGDECADSVVRISGAQSDGGAEGKAGEDYWKGEFVFEPVEGDAHVFDFADTAGVLAFA